MRNLNITVNIKSVGHRFGTVGWLNQQLKNGEILLEESNHYYFPPWSNDDVPPCTLTHGLIMKSKDNKRSALIAYRSIDGEYRHGVSYATSQDFFSHWSLPLTEAAVDALTSVCKAWIEAINLETNPDEEIAITIKRSCE